MMTLAPATSGKLGRGFYLTQHRRGDDCHALVVRNGHAMAF